MIKNSKNSTITKKMAILGIDSNRCERIKNENNQLQLLEFNNYCSSKLFKKKIRIYSYS